MAKGACIKRGRISRDIGARAARARWALSTVNGIAIRAGILADTARPARTARRTCAATHPSTAATGARTVLTVS